MILSTCVFMALILDKSLGEPSRFHPLVGFGFIAQRIERWLIRGANRYLRGVLALLIVLMPFAIVGSIIEQVLTDEPIAYFLCASFVLYHSIAWNSLLQHGLAVIEPLKSDDLVAARKAVSMIVSRDTAGLDREGISKATTESILENGADAIFSAIFWFLLAGLPGIILYRLSNTLDAMWGYKNERYHRFGWAAARLDDVLNYVPARLTALTYALLGNTRSALYCWRKQGAIWKSPNAGPVMAAGAGAINVSLGGSAQYHSRTEIRPTLGPEYTDQVSASEHSIEQAGQLVSRGVYLWLISVVVCDGLLVYLL